MSDAKYVHYVLSGYEALSDTEKLPNTIGDLKPFMRSSVAWNVRQQFEISEAAKGKRWEELPDDTIVLVPIAEDAEAVLGVENPGLTKDGRLVSRG